MFSHDQAVTGINKTSADLPKRHLTVPPECPFVHLHSVTVTESRGDRIRRARDLRRLSRDELAATTGVNPKTIARIERGEVSTSPSIAILEDHLNITPEPASHHTTALRDVNDLDLIAELARRLAARRATSDTIQLGPEGHFRWNTRDAPYPEHGQPETGGEGGIAEGRGGA